MTESWNWRRQTETLRKQTRAPLCCHGEQNRLLCHQNLNATEVFEAQEYLSSDRWGIILSVYVLKVGNPLCDAHGPMKNSLQQMRANINKHSCCFCDLYLLFGE